MIQLFIKSIQSVLSTGKYIITKTVFFDQRGSIRDNYQGTDNINARSGCPHS
jgi:hypothetical protein